MFPLFHGVAIKKSLNFSLGHQCRSIRHMRDDIGIVTNITNFGCFVDIGIKENGLVHVSQLADRFVSNPADVVRIHQHVRVKVMSIDHERKRIQLTMKGLNN